MSDKRFQRNVRPRIRIFAALIAAVALVLGLVLASPVTSEPSRQAKTTAKQKKKAKPVQSAAERAPRRFKHSESGHKDHKCTKCHLKGNKDATKTRPGRKDHGPCDTCHSTLFYTADLDDDQKKQKKRVCQTCHMEKEPSNWKAMPKDKLAPYPSLVHSDRFFRVEFSHKNHVGYENSRVENCKTCHLGGPRSKGAGAKPSHENCNECHSVDAGVKPTLSDCKGCHIENKGDNLRLPDKWDKINNRVREARKACRIGVVEMTYAVGKVNKKNNKPAEKRREGKFSHKNHLDRGDSYGKLGCASCHDNVRNANKLLEIALFGDARGVKIKEKTCAQKKCHTGKKKAAFGIKQNAACKNCHGPGCKPPQGDRPDLVDAVIGSW